MTDGGYHPRLSDAASGQQKGSKRSKSSLCNRAEISVEVPQTRMNRAIARQSSPIVVSVEQACHAGGRGFESRRSRSKPPGNGRFSFSGSETDLPLDPEADPASVASSGVRLGGSP